jgi:hypothetical protein
MTWRDPGVPGHRLPHEWLGVGQPWLRIRDTFDRVPAAHSLAAPAKAAPAGDIVAGTGGELEAAPARRLPYWPFRGSGDRAKRHSKSSVRNPVAARGLVQGAAVASI